MSFVTSQKGLDHTCWFYGRGLVSVLNYIAGDSQQLKKKKKLCQHLWKKKDTRPLLVSTNQEAHRETGFDYWFLFSFLLHFYLNAAEQGEQTLSELNLLSVIQFRASVGDGKTSGATEAPTASLLLCRIPGEEVIQR